MQNTELQPTRILLDTDLGDDIDDALALALALQSPELDIIGITTVYKNTQARAGLARQILRLYGREDIPVFAGCGAPLVEPANITEMPCQCSTLPSETLKADTTLHAVQIIIDTLRREPNTILVAIGPLTNVALAMRLAPEVLHNANIVFMGGCYARPFAEWNVLCDPEASKIVFEEARRLTTVGLDITNHCVLGADEIQLIQNSTRSQAKFLHGLIELWRQQEGDDPLILHDALVIAGLIQPELLRFHRGRVLVETGGGVTRGFTVEQSDCYFNRDDGSVSIADHVVVDAFLSLFTHRVFL